MEHSQNMLDLNDNPPQIIGWLLELGVINEKVTQA